MRQVQHRLHLLQNHLLGVLIEVLVIASWTIESSATSIAITKMATGFSYGLTYTATVVITSRLVPQHMRAAGQGLMSVTSSLGPVIGAAIGGLVFQHVGSHGLFLGSAVGLLLAAGLAAAVSLGEFGAASFLSDAQHPALTVLLMRQLGRPAESSLAIAAVMALVLALTAAIAIALSQSIARRAERVRR